MLSLINHIAIVPISIFDNCTHPLGRNHKSSSQSAHDYAFCTSSTCTCSNEKKCNLL